MKDIKNYEGLYAITSCGKVWSYKYKKFLKPEIVGGYSRVTLSKNSETKKIFIHRLVAEAYIPNPNSLPQVGHKDETRDNNSVPNLYWTDAKDNSNMPLRVQRLSAAKKRQVYCIELDRVFDSATDAAQELTIPRSSISSCCAGRYKTAGGYHWQYYGQN